MYGRARAIDPAAQAVEEVPTRTPRAHDAVTAGEIEDARLGFFQILRLRRVPKELRERHGDDLFAQAAYEFSRKLAQGETIESPAGWIVGCAWHRTIDLLRSQRVKPRLVSPDSVPEPPAAASWEPEQSFLSEDRLRQVREAVDQLPDNQRELIERSYFEEQSVREAARQMGWSTGKAQRAHESARKKLRLLLGDLENSGLKIEVGLAAFLSVSASGRAAAATLPSGIEAVVQKAGDAISGGWRRAVDLARHPLGRGRSEHVEGLAPAGTGRASEVARGLAETVASGQGRAIEVCKVLAVCAISGGAVTGAVMASGHGNSGGNAGSGKPAPRHAERPDPRDGTGSNVDTPASPTPTPEDTVGGASAGGSSGSGGKTATPALADSHAAADTSDAKKTAEGSDSREEFGAFGGRAEESGSSETGSGTGEASSYSADESSASSEGESTGSASTTKETAEKKAAAEQFGGAVR